MRAYAFHIVNVFTVGADRFSGNPLCVFPDARGVSDAEMGALARQMNLSETTFVLPSEIADAHVRIFTPSFELPFAGHPTLGTAFVIRAARGLADAIALEMKVGRVEVTHHASAFTLRTAREPESRAPTASRAEIAEMLSLPADAIAADPLWLDTGAEQLVIPLASAGDVERASPSAELLLRHGFSKKRGASMAYVFARVGEDEVTARFFFVSNGGVVEDPATGSACANLGGYMLETNAPLPVSLRVRQGHAVGRPSELGLTVDAEQRVFVRGEVIELGRGSVSL
jgi:trans-2,3-dihydro-3-hydroxyanthranilate isomerase